MGFEVKYYFHAAKSVGEYDKETKQESTIKVGSPYEEVSLDTLAGKVLALMARRNILVVGVEIYEMVKKPINFREAEDGIVIKNKKFRFDDGAFIEGSEITPVTNAQPTLEVSQSAQVENSFVKTTPVKNAMVGKTPLRYEFFNPDDWDGKRSELWNIALQQNPSFRVTWGKRYPIYSEKVAGRGMLYTVVDDNGKSINLFSNLFSNIARPQLMEDGMVQSDRGGGLSDGNLKWDGLISGEAPSLRR